MEPVAQEAWEDLMVDRANRMTAVTVLLAARGVMAAEAATAVAALAGLRLESCAPEVPTRNSHH